MSAGLKLNTVADREAVLSLPVRADFRVRTLAGRIGQGFVILAMAVASYFLVSHFLVQSVMVTGWSMNPTLSDGDRYLLNRWIYHVRAPQRSEIVVIRDPADNRYSVKRIVAVAGDSVVIKRGRVYVNGRKCEESYLIPGTVTLAPLPGTEQSFNCGKDQYFLLGDNRNNSVDSRTYGLVPRANILGLVVR